MLFKSSYYAEVENSALLCDVSQVMENDSWRSWKSHGNFLGKKYGNHTAVTGHPQLLWVEWMICDGHSYDSSRFDKDFK